MLLAEASPQRLVVTNADYRYLGDIGHRFVLPVPTGDRLVRV